MNSTDIKTVIFTWLLTSTAYAQDFTVVDDSVAETRDVLESSGNLNTDDIETIMELLSQNTETEESTLSDNSVVEKKLSNREVSPNLRATSYINSDSWQVVRITKVASEDYSTVWDVISQYHSITPNNHGGSWLLVETEEQAFQPLFGIIDVSAKFRYWNATELVNSRVNISNGIYTGFRRYWVIENNFTSGEFQFSADYSQQLGYNFTHVHLHRELDIR